MLYKGTLRLARDLNTCSKQPMRKSLRHFRIAFSAVCGIACLLSIALWVRSFSYWDDAVLRIGSHSLHPISAEGRIIMWIQPTTVTWRFRLNTDPLSIHQPADGGKIQESERHPWFGIGFWPALTTIVFAHCVLVMLFGALAIIPWLPTRFTVRGLLISTTTIALVICLILWADRL